MNNQINFLLQQAVNSFGQGDLGQTKLLINNALKIQPKNFLALHIMGVTLGIENKHKEARDFLLRAVKINPNDSYINFNLAKALSETGNDLDSIKYHQAAIKITPNHPEAWLNFGRSLFQLRRYVEALAHYEQAIQLKPDYAEAWFNKGLTLSDLKRYDEALAHYEQAIQLKPDYAKAWFNKGVTFYDLKRYDEALAHYEQAIQLKPDYAEAWSNKGVTLSDLKRYDEALAHYEQAIQLKPDYAEAWSNKGLTLSDLKRYDEALAHYEQAIQLKPDYAELWSNKGLTLSDLKRYDEALAHYEQAIQLKPDYAKAWFNKGVTFYDLKRYDEALAHYEQAIQLKPDYAEAWSNKGVILYDLKRYDQAIAHYDKALSLKHNIDWRLGGLLHTKMKICSWSGLTESLAVIYKKLDADEKVVSPFVLLSLTDDSLLHKKSSEIYIQSKYQFNPVLESILKRPRCQKIRLGYFSPDFRNHPVSFLTAELFESHNRDRFEVFAFSLQQSPVGDETNLRLRRGFDKFFDVGNMSDKEIAQLARHNEVDIAIDLAGSTQYSRTGIFSYRTAPIQVNWLGYPGTIGADFIDYIVADKIIIPETHRKFYVEKVVCLPDTYMVDDSKRVASSRRFTREECGLPKNSFVFCCFNNDYKFNSQVLDGWSRILLKVENSVLWISENNQSFKTNIASEFEKRGLDRSRLIFAKRLESMADHLARYNIADLFLDTYPYNAHTTTLDSLKAGVPVLTLMGQSFASRVAASLLSAIGLPELITSSRDEYEALAIELAINSNKLEDIKLKLANKRLTTPLFNTPLFTKNIEAAYIKMMERYQENLQPDHIVF